MSSVSSINPGIASLLESLSNSAALAPALSSPVVQSALQNAPAADVVQLSSQAIQLQELEAIFGNPGSSTGPATGLSSLLSGTSNGATNNLTGLVNAAVQASETGTSPLAADPTARASQFALEQSGLQAEQAQALFGTDSSVASNPLVNLLA